MDETDYLTISERVTNDWKEKLEVLRSHHRNQSREQQAQHLEELRILQEDLLKDITHFMSKVKEELRDSSVEPSQEAVQVAGEAHSLHEEEDNVSLTCERKEGDERVEDQLFLDVGVTDSSKTPQTLLPSPAVPNIASLNSSMRAEHPHTQDSTVDTSFPSSKVYSTTYSNGVMTEPSVHTPPVTVASQALPSRREGRGQTQLLTDVVQKLQDVVGIKEEPSRTSQVAKFDRHMQDLKTYYESEISTLKERLNRMGEEEENNVVQEDENDFSELPGGELKRTHTQSSLSSSQYQGLDNGTEGKLLEEFCKKLQEQLEDNEMQNRKLHTENESLTSMMRKLQVECDEAEQKIKSLEMALKEMAVKQEAEQRSKAEMEKLTSELNKCKQEREQDLMNIDELLQEVEELQMENRELHNITIDCKMALEERNNEIESLRESLKMHKATEDKYKSVILGLENDLRRLEHSRNRERSMQTHYTLGEERKPRRVMKSHSSDQIVTPSPRSGHKSPSGKLKSPSRTDIAKQVSAPCSPKDVPKSTSRTLLKEGDKCSMKASGVPGDAFPYSSSMPIQGGIAEAMTPKSFAPLTKRKWLESSDPGLFGSTTPSTRSGSVLNGSRVVKAPAPTPVLLSNSDVRIVDLEEEGVGMSGTPGHEVLKTDSLEMDRNLEEVHTLAEAALQAIKEGRVMTDEGGTGKDKKGSYGDWWKKHMAVVAKAEARLVELGAEKDQLESALQRTPKPGSIVNRHDKRIQMERERRLDEVVQEMGRVRMTLKKHRAL